MRWKLFQLLSKIVPDGYIKDWLRLFYNRYISNFSLKGYIRHYDIKKGDIIVDAGAYPGEFCIYASKKVCETGKVICFEPNQNNFNVMLRLTRNRKNIILINKGLWKEDINLKMRKLGGQATVSNFGDDDIKVAALDTELNRLRINSVDFIKMDIEGAEIEALYGMENTLKTNNTNLAIASYHIVNGEQTHKQVEIILKYFGYYARTEYPKHLTTYGKMFVNKE